MHFQAEPQENLTQLYPYPEKADEPSSSTPSKPVVPSITPSITKAPTTTVVATHAPTEEPTLSFRQPSARVHDSQSTQSTLPEQSQYGEDINMDCFDVDLDSVSADQAALLAEKMLAMIFLGPPNESSPSASHQASTSSRRADHIVSQSRSPTHAAIVKQESDADEGEDEATQPRQDHTQVKAEPPSSFDLFFSGPTQERASKEINVVICGTYLPPQKKVILFGRFGCKGTYGLRTLGARLLTLLSSFLHLPPRRGWTV